MVIWPLNVDRNNPVVALFTKLPDVCRGPIVYALDALQGYTSGEFCTTRLRSNPGIQEVLYEAQICRLHLRLGPRKEVGERTLLIRPKATNLSEPWPPTNSSRKPFHVAVKKRANSLITQVKVP